jgi:cell division inhibitor SepF
MGIWDSVKKFAQPYADDEYDDYDDMEGYEETPRRSRSAASEGNTSFNFDTASSTPSAKSGSFSGQVLNINSGKQEVVLFRPTSVNDCTKAADDLRDKKAIIVNMENVDDSLARRVVDFLSGCAYALDGKVNKIAHSTYLFCPHSMDVIGDLENIPVETESYV